MKNWEKKWFTLPKDKAATDGEQVFRGLGSVTPGVPFRAQHAQHAKALEDSGLFTIEEDAPDAKDEAATKQKDGKK